MKKIKICIMPNFIVTLSYPNHYYVGRYTTNGYLPEQIYNADETGIYYKMLPDKTLAVKSDQRRKEGFKAIKDRLTILFTVNKTGSHKLKPLCIGKSRAPRKAR
jgi:hypothetical protein